jgi:hypothetical protein
MLNTRSSNKVTASWVMGQTVTTVSAALFCAKCQSSVEKSNVLDIDTSLYVICPNVGPLRVF